MTPVLVDQNILPAWGSCRYFVTNLVSECSRFGSVVARSLLDWVKMQGRVSIFHHSVTQHRGYCPAPPASSIPSYQKLVKGHEGREVRDGFRQKASPARRSPRGKSMYRNLQLP